MGIVVIWVVLACHWDRFPKSHGLSNWKAPLHSQAPGQRGDPGLFDRPSCLTGAGPGVNGVGGVEWRSMPTDGALADIGVFGCKH
jgi:hypothetical protein